MAKLYKLTTQNNLTRAGHYNETEWGENVTHSIAKKDRGVLCGAGILHAYEHPIFAIIYNNQHASIHNPKLWECKGVVAERESHKKCGTFKLTTVKEIEHPTGIQLRKFVILCTLEVYPLWQAYDKNSVWKKWADLFLNGEYAAATSAAASASAAAYAAANAANAANADDAYAANAAYAAASAAAYAANAAANAANAANAAYAANAAAYAAAKATAYAANAAAYAAVYANGRYGKGIDFIKLAKKAMK